MRTNIEIDDKLMKATMKATGARTKREAVDLAMRKTLQIQRQGKALRALFGSVPDWDFDYKKARESKFGTEEW